MIDASVLVVGAGAIGGVTAAKMVGGVRRVAVLDANTEHVERMRAGLDIDVLGEERRVELEAHAGPSGLEGPFDFALVTLKATHLEAALTPLVERGLVRTYVSLGNGLVQERIAGIVGSENLIWGTVEWGSTNLGPGRLAQTTRAPFVIGEPDGETRDRTRLLAEALGTVEDVRLTENIRGQVWSKLLVNSSLSGLGERFEPPRMLLDLVEEGRTGTKSGAGFLDYTDEERERLLLERDRRYSALLELLERLPPAGAGRGEG